MVCKPEASWCDKFIKKFWSHESDLLTTPNLYLLYCMCVFINLCLLINLWRIVYYLYIKIQLLYLIYSIIVYAINCFILKVTNYSVYERDICSSTLIYFHVFVMYFATIITFHNMRKHIMFLIYALLIRVNKCCSKLIFYIERY